MGQNVCKVAIIGCGGRGGRTYGPMFFRNKEKFSINSVCDIKPDRVDCYKALWSLDEKNCFYTEESFFEEKHGDLLVVATQDRDHVRHAIRGLELGYDILLEKPISPVKEELLRLLEAQKKYNRKILVCHVLRYAPAFLKMKALLDEGVIGKMLHIEWIEQVGWWHQAHSFVRGNWRNEAETSPMIMAKCCHDLDLLQYYAASRAKTVYSEGEISFFNEKNKPEGATDRCETCPHIKTCKYSAERIYIDRWSKWKPACAWPYNTFCFEDPMTEEGLRHAYQTTGYGRCVFACDNDVVDNQTVMINFENGVKATLTMSAFTNAMGRRCAFHGTEGELIFDERRDEIRVCTFFEEEKVYKISELLNDSMLNSYGHGGGDFVLVETIYDMIFNGKEAPTSLENSVESHLIALAAEESRKSGKTVSIH